MWNITDPLLVIGKDVMRLPFTEVQCCSLSVGDGKRCDEIAFHKMCSVTYSLLVIGNDVMRLPFTKCAVLLTRCWLYDKM